jgi:hypothetical protein
MLTKHLLSPNGPRASFLRVLTVVHLVLVVVIVGGFLWVDPASITDWFTTFATSRSTLSQRAVLFVAMGSGGLHIAIAVSAVLVPIALSRGRAPATRTRLLGVYLAFVLAFLVVKAVALVIGLQMQLPMFDIQQIDSAGAVSDVNPWGIVALLLAHASLACIPAFALVLSTPLFSPRAASAPASPAATYQ